MSFLKKLFAVMSNDKYRQNPNGSKISIEQYSALNVAAINAEQTMYYCDSIETGSDINEVTHNLSSYYGIFDRESALETLNWLNDSGHRVYFDIIKGYIGGSTSNIDTSVFALEEDDLENINEYIGNLKECLEILIKKNYINKKEDLSSQSILGWDMGRLVLVTRCCYECRYITEEEAWDYIFGAHNKCKDDYQNWAELSSGYIIGRSMWNGNNMMLDGLMEITKDLLQDEESPWMKCKLK